MMLLAVLAACEKPVVEDVGDAGKERVTLTFAPTGGDVTRGNGVAMYFTKLNVQMFDSEGEKMFEPMRTQTADESDFCQMTVTIPPGTYTVVAVGHSSVRSATIKSPELVQFTASDGEKLTDTFCHCSTISVGGDNQAFTLDMYRVAAMVQFCLADNDVPESFAKMKIDYTGGSANFNPTTMEGCTKSTQSEARLRNSMMTHQVYTFPYMAASCFLKMTVTATDEDGNIIRKRSFDEVPVTRNRITTYTGKFFEDGDGVFTQSDFSFVIHADWDGEDKYTY